MKINITRSKLYFVLIIILFGLSFYACDFIMPPEVTKENVLNVPNHELTGAQLSLHLQGDAEFGRKFSVSDGLGPIFVSNSCENCHFSDGKGHPSINLIRFGRQNTDGSFDHLINFGGPQLQNRSIDGYPVEEIPSGVTGQSIFVPPAVAGLGFLAAVEDADILNMADPLDNNSDGISGIPNYISAPDYFVPQPYHIPENGKYIGRFGRKAGAIDLLHQVVNAYHQDMGITSDFIMEDLYNYKTGVKSGDLIPEPEINSSIVNLVVFYVRTLSAPPRRNSNEPEVLKGEKVFKEIACASCHMPSLKTGHSDIEALSNKTFYPYTDLLLHDMGDELDDKYTEGTALYSEWRTTPLWGLGLGTASQGGKLFLMHDGRANTIEEAIEFHGGEANNSRVQFRNLSKQDKDRLIKFLMSL